MEKRACGIAGSYHRDEGAREYITRAASENIKLLRKRLLSPSSSS
jgi:hypothetical protein